MSNQTNVTMVPNLASSLLSSNWQPQYSRDPGTGIKYDFFTTFSVFFPAVTGIMAGANMSGDLVSLELWCVRLSFSLIFREHSTLRLLG